MTEAWQYPHTLIFAFKRENTVSLEKMVIAVCSLLVLRGDYEEKALIKRNRLKSCSVECILLLDFQLLVFAGSLGGGVPIPGKETRSLNYPFTDMS